MNIAFLYRIYPSYGGVEVVTTILSNKFIEDGHEVTIFSFEQGNNELLEQLNQKVKLQFLKYPVLSYYNVSYINRVIKENHIDVFINQWGLPFKTTMLCRLALKGTSCKLVSVLHGSPNVSKVVLKIQDRISKTRNVLSKCFFIGVLNLVEMTIKRSIRYAVKHNAKYVLLSKGFIQPLVEFAELKAYSDVVAIGNPVTIPVDLDGFSLKNKKKQLLYVGRMDFENKRVNRIVDAWESLYKDYPNWELVLVGDGPHKKELVNDVKQRNIQNVVFEGFRKEPPIEFYKNASIFLLTSDLEGFGLVIIESMSYGVVPIVYGSYEAVYDIIRDGKSGFITPKPYCKENTIGRLKNLMDNPARINYMAKEAMKDASYFSIENITKQWYNLFDEVMS
ncbi:glycosyltransferase [Phocaeicola sartorii]|uniref:Glycosyltransferase family 4 protein n=1 Tax=Phocaeicola sartorii TaxID=671267 RepID=R9I8Z3_9BACT|nr:glycosyltransferase [Phocaeicola sartorii]EOS12804.1 hypothetical protein C802_01959 [Phocaeicola sartorii]MCR1847347.1 glycosyltransferase [Phocaeicola sartorii]NUK98621.1 glycosyltransferase [Phocaeicola sartorii]